MAQCWSVAALLLTFLASTLESGHSLKILGLFPHPGISHFHFFHPIMRGLAEAGHNVTVISHFPDESPPVGYKDLPLTGVAILQNAIDLNMHKNRAFYRHLLDFFIIYDWGKQACEATLHSEALNEVLDSGESYDIIIMEQFNTDCMMGVAHFLKAPVIALSSCGMMPWHYERFGMPFIPSYIPAFFMGHSEEMDFKSRIGNWISFHAYNTLYNLITIPATDALLRHKFGHDMPSVGELVKGTSMFFVNQHYSLSGAKPLPPSVIELGGVHIQKANALPDDIQQWLDDAEYGVVFISWGSLIRADTLPAAKRDGLVKALKSLKQRVIWKWENGTLPSKPDNVFVSRWLPQREILCHPNVKVFMSHGGLLGATEAAYCGVPTVVMPMFGDQFLNAAALKQRGMGVILDYEDMSEKTVLEAVKKALQKSYMDNAKNVAHSFNHRSMTPLQTAIWWIEYVAQSEGGTLTKSSSVFMSRFTYYSLDVYLFFSVVFVCLAYILLKFIKKTAAAATKLKSD